MLASPAVWVTSLIAAAALLVLLMPAEWATSIQGAISGAPSAPEAATAPAAVAVESPPVAAAPLPAVVAPADVASAALVEAAASAVVVEMAASAVGGLPSTDTSVASAGAGPLQLKASAETWVEVVDGQSKVLLSRMLSGGEVLVLDGATPFRLKIGNAAGTEVAFRGQAVNLASSTRDNVARLELK